MHILVCRRIDKYFLQFEFKTVINDISNTTACKAHVCMSVHAEHVMVLHNSVNCSVPASRESRGLYTEYASYVRRRENYRLFLRSLYN